MKLDKNQKTVLKAGAVIAGFALIKYIMKVDKPVKEVVEKINDTADKTIKKATETIIDITPKPLKPTKKKSTKKKVTKKKATKKKVTKKKSTKKKVTKKKADDYEKSFEQRKQLREGLIKGGSSKEDALHLSNKHHEYVFRVYAEATLKEKLDVIRTLG